MKYFLSPMNSNGGGEAIVPAAAAAVPLLASIPTPAYFQYSHRALI